jgi:hypothetical protein
MRRTHTHTHIHTRTHTHARTHTHTHARTDTHLFYTLLLLTDQNLLSLVGVAVQARPWLAAIEFMQYGSLRDALRVRARV